MSVKYFESQQEGEEVVLLIRRHVLALVSVIAIAVLIYLIGLIAVFVLPFIAPVMVKGFALNIYVILISLLFLFNTIFLFNNWVLHYLHVAILTTEHFVEINQMGLFARKVSEMTLEKIQDVSASQKGLLHTMFDIGEVVIETAGEAPNFVIEFAPDPNKISQQIMDTERIYCEMHGIRTAGVGGNANNNTFIQQANAMNPQSQPEMPEPNIEYPGEQWK